MKIVLQRVSSASVSVEGETVGEIGGGLVVLLGVGPEDSEEIVDAMVSKIGKLRIFADCEGKTNRSLQETGGQILVVSQFTLYADCRKGNRPSFAGAAGPGKAEKLYQYFVKQCGSICEKVQCGCFGRDMQVALVNDGPFTLVLER